jgi:predicted nucleic acid-binding protein
MHPSSSFSPGEILFAPSTSAPPNSWQKLEHLRACKRRRDLRARRSRLSSSAKALDGLRTLAAANRTLRRLGGCDRRGRDRVDITFRVDHLRVGDSTLAALLDPGEVLTHPFVIGELALGSLRNRDVVTSLLSHLPSSAVATDSEVLSFIGRNALFGRGVGYVDVHLLAAARLTTGSSLWTKDERLGAVAAALGLATPGRP